MIGGGPMMWRSFPRRKKILAGKPIAIEFLKRMTWTKNESRKKNKRLRREKPLRITEQVRKGGLPPLVAQTQISG
jgi:hypothetical protein